MGLKDGEWIGRWEGLAREGKMVLVSEGDKDGLIVGLLDGLETDGTLVGRITDGLIVGLRIEGLLVGLKGDMDGLIVGL